MKKKEIKGIMRRLGMVPRDQDNGWVGSSCPLAPVKDEHGQFKFHATGHDNSPSFGIMQVHGESTFFCLACKQSGLLKYLPSRMSSIEGIDRDALEEVARDIRTIEDGLLVTLPEEDEEEPDLPIMPEIAKGLFPAIGGHPAAIAYCKKRGISFEATVLAQAKYDPDKKRIVFPVIDPDGQLYGFAGRAVYDNPKVKVLNYLNLRKARHILGAHLWEPGKPCLIIEGVIGYASLLSQGFHKVFNVGAIMGSKMSAIQAAALSTYAEVYLMLDNDKAGIDGTWGKEGAARIINTNVFTPEWPEGLNDPDQLRPDHIPAILAANMAIFDDRY